MENFKIGIVGMGRIGARHLECIQQIPGAVCVGIVELSPGMSSQQSTVSGQQYAVSSQQPAVNSQQLAVGSGQPAMSIPQSSAIGQQYAINFYSDIKEMLDQQPEIQLVSICTPSGLHYAQARKVLESGRHVLIEKPAAFTVQECESLLQIAATVNREVFVMLQLRASKSVLSARHLISSGALGSIKKIEVNCRWHRGEEYYKNSGNGNWHGTRALDGGVLYTQFSHIVDVLNTCMPGLEVSEATLRNDCHHNVEIEDSGEIYFDFPGGKGVFHYTVCEEKEKVQTTIRWSGEKQILELSGQLITNMHVYPKMDTFLVGGQQPAVSSQQLAVSGPQSVVSGQQLAVSGQQPADSGLHSLVYQQIISHLLQGTPANEYQLQSCIPGIHFIEQAYIKGHHK